MASAIDCAWISVAAYVDIAECHPLPEAHNQQRYDLFIGEVAAAWADPDVFVDGRWRFADEGRQTIHYAAGGQFFVTGEVFELGLA